VTQESGALTNIASVAPPAMKPLFGTRPAPDVLLDIAHKLAKPLDLPWQTFEEMLQASFNTLGEEAWSEAQKQGGYWGQAGERLQGSPAAGRAEAARGSSAAKADAGAPVALTEPTFNGDAGSYPYQFLPYPTIQFADGSTSHLPWMQEMPDPTTSAMWSSWVEINPKTAEQLNIRLGDIVEVASTVGSLRSPAFINPALAPNVIAMPVGQGHTTFTRYASGRGQNPMEILAPVAEPMTGALAWAATRVKVTRVGDPDGKLILFSARGELREKPHEGATR
jgi:menaquinone reductase, molybdopterin-binding-like subunit